ncbi:alpha-defensin-related sequence 2-like [Mus pahari]|uniref:alpha-defensin-related sequence 2-like n=1 Tax=Mus pahari TaxID=10093 RepID=UPI000A312CE2|nr:alpha-defensin-related sequence 2-like [Mus pahari]
MKTLVLLSALVLMAFYVQVDPTQETYEETKTEEQPGEEDQGVSVSSGVPERYVLDVAGQEWPPQCPKCPVCLKCPQCPQCPGCPRCNCMTK